MRLEWSPQSEKDLRKFPDKERERVTEAMEVFAEAGTGDVGKLQGSDRPEWRLPMGSYLARFTGPRDGIYILRVRYRSQA